MSILQVGSRVEFLYFFGAVSKADVSGLAERGVGTATGQGWFGDAANLDARQHFSAGLVSPCDGNRNPQRQQGICPPLTLRLRIFIQNVVVLAPS
jgi:hypothetical protein